MVLMEETPTIPLHRLLAITLVGAIVWTIILLPVVALADDGYSIDSPEYQDRRLCWVQTGDTGEHLVLLDTWEYVDHGTPGQGSSVHAVPCIPTACPDGYTLVSTSCWTHDPFSHVPVLDQGADSVSPSSPTSTVSSPGGLMVDVGPLVEPSIPTISR